MIGETTQSSTNGYKTSVFFLVLPKMVFSPRFIYPYELLDI